MKFSTHAITAAVAISLTSGSLAGQPSGGSQYCHYIEPVYPKKAPEVLYSSPDCSYRLWATIIVGAVILGVVFATLQHGKQLHRHHHHDNSDYWSSNRSSDWSKSRSGSSNWSGSDSGSSYTSSSAGSTGASASSGVSNSNSASSGNSNYSSGSRRSDRHDHYYDRYRYSDRDFDGAATRPVFRANSTEFFDDAFGGINLRRTHH